MITDSKKQHYLAVKKYDGDFYCLSCFHSYSAKDNFIKHHNVCNDLDYCYLEMPNEDSKILKYNHGQKSMKVPFVTYADLESYLKEQVLVIIILKNHQQPK